MNKLESYDFVLKKWSKNSIRHPSLNRKIGFSVVDLLKIINFINKIYFFNKKSFDENE